MPEARRKQLQPSLKPAAPYLPTPLLTRRCGAVPEARRKQLYDEYHAILAEAGRVVAAPAGGGSRAGASEAAASPEQLDWLREEQARLKEEYARSAGGLSSQGTGWQLGDLIS